MEEDSWMRMDTLVQSGSSRGMSSDGQIQRRCSGVPIFAYLLLPAAVFAVSSAATVFEVMGEVPPLTLAAWRLQLTALILGLGAVWNWRAMTPEARSQAWASAPLLLGSGLCLAVHFGAWVWGLEHTTLTHSLLFVSCTPILIAMWALVTRQPITRLELAGTALGLMGGVLLATSTVAPQTSASNSTTGDSGSSATVDSGRQEPHLSGDLASLAAAVAMVGYLAVGRKLRSWMPIFVYACPVTGVAALALTLVGASFETASAAEAGIKGGVFGWLVSGRYAALVSYLALVPGIVGHTGFNTLLKYMTPLAVSLGFQLEPLVGSFIGWAAGVMAAPGWVTYLGGTLLLAATVIVTGASSQREQAVQQQEVRSQELSCIFAGKCEGFDEDGELEETTALIGNDGRQPSHMP